jgi:hypothetical protein
MRNYLLYGLAAAILFAVSASASLWWQNRQKDVADQGRSLANSDTDPGEARVLFHSRKPNAEEPGTPAANLGDREKALRDREMALTQRERSMDLIARDLQKERAALEMLRKQVQETLREMSVKTGPAALHKSDLDILREAAAGEAPQARARAMAPGAAGGADLVQLVAEFHRMAPELAAQRLRELDQRDKVLAGQVWNKLDESFQNRVLATAPPVPAAPEAPAPENGRGPTVAPTLPMPPPAPPSPPAVVPPAAPLPIR